MNEAIMIRKATLEDIPGILKIEEASFPSPWQEATFLDELYNASAHYLVAVWEGSIIGFTGYWQVLDEGHIMNIAVSPDYRGQGVGRELFAAMLQDGKPRGVLYWTLEVRVSNSSARHLYESFGFQLAGIRPGYYAGPREDAAIYWKTDE